jgi:hypothetical protein
MDRRTGSPAEAESWLPDNAARRQGKPRRAGSSRATQPEDWLPAGAALDGGRSDVIAPLRVARTDALPDIRPTPQWPAIGSFDPNAVGPGELLRLGLSRTQTARFLARREQLGGFGAVEDFDELRGFPAALRDKLKAAARISA